MSICRYYFFIFIIIIFIIIILRQAYNSALHFLYFDGDY